ncbi:family 1 glycosylhydrolase, partial [Bacillus altitudinis]|uniref:family 1 glycosylhydrolase n=1 Tax=Bacillus altitudinis TaxID=293387 RepID=UPI0011A1F8C4
VEGGWKEDGKGPSVIDMRERYGEGRSDFKVGRDHYDGYKEEVKMFGEMGLKGYGLCIGWRGMIVDGDGEMNEKGIELYDSLIDELGGYDIEGIVTMYD